MRINKKKPFCLEVTLNWEDFKRLDKGEIIGDYDGENKLIIHRAYPFNPDDCKSRLESLKQKGHCRLDRTTMDIDIYIPHGVLRDTRISASNFSKRLGNFEIIPESCGEPWDSAQIKVVYPGNLKVLDIPTYAESLVSEDSAHSE